MSSGSIIRGALNSSSYLSKTWSGADDPKHHNENAYFMELYKHSASGPLLSCFPNCDTCEDWVYPVSVQALNSGPVLDALQYTVNDATLKVQSRLTDAIRGHSLDLGNNIAEGHQTASMIHDFAQRLGAAAYNLRKRDYLAAAINLLQPASGLTGKNHFNKRRQIEARERLKLSDVPSAHLATIYGVKPFIEDLFESANAYAAIANKPRAWVTRAYGSSARDVNAQAAAYWVNPGRLRTGVDLRAHWTEVLSVPRSLGLLDPIGMAWETTYMSFVADWFIPIGTYFDNLNILPEVNVNVMQTTKSKLESHFGFINPAYLCGPYWSGYSAGNGVSLNAVTMRLTRTPSTHYTAANIELPRFKPLDKVFSPGHIANSIALIGSFLTGGLLRK